MPKGTTACKNTYRLFLLMLFILAIVFLIVKLTYEGFTTYQGHMIPLETPAAPLNHADQSMFIFANNKCDPSCCPSPYSCDKGCVCLTDEQKNLMSGPGSYQGSCPRLRST